MFTAVIFGRPAGKMLNKSPPWFDLLQGGDSLEVKAPGLPNITGKATGFNLGGHNGTITDNGQALIAAADGAYMYSFGDYKQTMRSLSIDASKSDPIYGGAATVQPPAVSLLPQIKY